MPGFTGYLSVPVVVVALPVLPVVVTMVWGLSLRLLFLAPSLTRDLPEVLTAFEDCGLVLTL